MVITFTLQPAYSGATYVAGPFNISGTTNTGVTTELASNVSKSTLLAGLEITGIDDNTIGGTIQSIGTCNNSISWFVGGTASTYTFDLYCTTDATFHPTSNASYTSVSVTASELGVTPTAYQTYITIGGSPNTDYIYLYTGLNNEPETPAVTVSQVLTSADFICDSGTPNSYFCKDSEFAPCIEQASPCTGGQISCSQVQV